MGRGQDTHAMLNKVYPHRLPSAKGSGQVDEGPDGLAIWDGRAPQRGEISGT